MALIKCTECGHEVSDKASVCPNCGAPIVKTNKCEECGKIIDSSNTSCPNCGAPIVASEREKTDTGTADEATIRTYANVMWVVCIVLGIIGIGVFTFFASIGESEGASLFGILGIVLLLLLVYVVRAFIRVLSNISINIHEINKKLH